MDSENNIESRIDAMAVRDRIIAIIFTVAMWVVLLFVYFFAARPVVPSAAISIALLVSLVVLGITNTASIISMIRAYAKDKEFIYRQDILNLDIHRRMKSDRKAERRG